jgi:hypothetical protein
MPLALYGVINCIPTWLEALMVPLVARKQGDPDFQSLSEVDI